jgi:S-adenosylmethionine-diacylglycerol 3-amino-3-carboxypropyl transferase
MSNLIESPRALVGAALERVVFQGLVFTICWEDPECDREALALTPTDSLVTITTAGCNTLNLLCQNPRRVVCVDTNPAQTALMELKVAAIRQLDYPTFVDIFAARRPASVRSVYEPRLRPLLSPSARRYWDRNLNIVADDIYRWGHMGVFMRACRFYLKARGLQRPELEAFFALNSVAEQRDFYERHIRSRLWDGLSERLVRSRFLLYLSGLHPNQVRLIEQERDLYDLARARFEHVLTELPIRGNYFWHLAVLGRLPAEALPPYLRAENFELLKERVNGLRWITGRLEDYLASQDAGSVDAFNLLDIFDWMDEAHFTETLSNVLRVASKGGRILYRSGCERRDPPPSLLDRLQVKRALSRSLLERERSATHGSLYVLERR